MKEMGRSPGFASSADGAFPGVDENRQPSGRTLPCRRDPRHRGEDRSRFTLDSLFTHRAAGTHLPIDHMLWTSFSVTLDIVFDKPYL